MNKVVKERRKFKADFSSPDPKKGLCLVVKIKQRLLHTSDSMIAAVLGTDAAVSITIKPRDR
jgi:hypothetical protein